ncbi:efflux RND transporter periplasmic adaptor subunit [Acidithiobacillus thiooxidans]|jgi:membrane fusion protein (multidrug efflux system)|uniref:efflux RND transporter periplasmic adaptor subunit n=1 Tax=Acidithiobacillus thiooxidans TaxID=930 RepID=UPI001C079FDA|nr:efflux RND transporter periplasmic adaptor subunit [Acidithiobacillus thiooxidans]MBU2838817.1 efflux RND transporter periplasmic adaptor subunit [Acidithiobacillus thiooxidans]
MRTRFSGGKILAWGCCLCLLFAGSAAAEVSALVKVTPARMMSMADQLRVYGTVEFAPEDGRTIVLPAETLVNQVLVAAGQRVRQGQPLLQIQASVSDQLQRKQAEIALKFAIADQQRVSSLRQRQLATNSQLQAADQSLARARATLQDIQLRLQQLQKGQVSAPINGVVTIVHVHQGDLVPAGQPLLSLSTANALRVLLGVEPVDLARLQVGDSVQLLPVYGGQEAVHGKIQQIYSQIDPQTRLAQVVVPLPASPDLMPGAMLQAEIILHRQKAVAVPESAVLQQGGRSYCFVDVAGKAQKRWVKTGWQQDGWIAVNQGLSVGDSVVSLGNYELKNGMALRIEGKS